MSSIERAWSEYRRLGMQEVERNDAVPGQLPHFGADDGRWVRWEIDRTSGWISESVYDHGNWTAGFSTGIRWLVAEPASPPGPGALRELAELTPRADDTTTHDLGFLFFPSFAYAQLRGLIATPVAEPALRAGRTLAARFHPEARFIQAFGSVGDPRSASTSTIDTMMNLPLLWWAGRRSEGDAGMVEIAAAHARTAASVFFRTDHSTYHLARIAPDSGTVLERGTFQGSAGDSCWSRGQAWAIAGFAWAWLATGDDEFKHVADRALAYFLAHLPSGSIPPWDFADHDAGAPRDASAAAIAALGALLLADSAEDERHRDAVRILSDLSVHAVRQDPDEEGILLRSCYSKPHGLGVDGPTPYGDFYYGLALSLAHGLSSRDELIAPTNREATVQERIVR